MIPSGRNILVVDDDPDFIWLIRNMLEQNGYRVSEARDGQSALALFEKDKPGVVLMDYRMPGRDGLDIALEMKDRDVSVPIIMITGYGEVRVAVHALKAGVYDYIMQACELRKLIFSAFIFVLIPLSASAKMATLSDTQLAGIIGQAGFATDSGKSSQKIPDELLFSEGSGNFRSQLYPDAASSTSIKAEKDIASIHISIEDMVVKIESMNIDVFPGGADSGNRKSLFTIGISNFVARISGDITISFRF